MTNNDNEKPRWLGKLACETTNHVYCRLGECGEVHAYPKRLGLGGWVKLDADHFSIFQKCFSKYKEPVQSVLRPITDFHTQV